MTTEAGIAFDQFLETDASVVADIARELCRTVRDAFPGAIETFDRADRLLAFGVGGSRRDFRFAIIPHAAHVNLQLADGADLPNPGGRIEGTGKRIRHVKVRSVEDAQASWVRDAIAAQLALHSG